MRAEPLAAGSLAFDGTLDGWRAVARAALAAGVAPEHADWRPAGDTQHGLDFGAGPGPVPNMEPNAAPHAAPAVVPRRFLGLAALVACHRDPERWAALYRVLWRLTRGGEPHLLAVAVDPDVLRLTAMAKAVRREVHKLHAFVRFRLVRAADGVDEYVAWFEPEHDVVERAAGLFVRRFANMRWAVLTPRASVRWDGRALAVGPGVPRRDAPSADALERLWGTYYAHIFNPARVKLQAMRAEMPKRYWRNLPEAPLIAPMVRDAPARVRRMIEAAARAPRGPAGARVALATPVPSGEPDALGRAAAARRIGDALVYEGSAAWERASAGDDATLGDAERLRRFAERFPLAVAESTRRRVFAPPMAALWAARAPAGLRFDVHAHAAMLGGGVRPHRLPRAVRDLLPAGLAGAERVAGELVPDAVREALWARFLAAITLLDDADRLGAVLLRVPRAVGPDRERAAALRDWLAQLAPWDVAVEFGAPAWSAPRLRARTDALLAAGGATRVLAAGEARGAGPFAAMRGGDEAWLATVAAGGGRVHVLR